MSKSHGHTVGGHRSPTYSSWYSMKKRCNDPMNEDYGMAGITYDPRWESFEDFLEDMGERPPGTSIDRIDFDKGYYKDNCRWATEQTQKYNRRHTNWIEFSGTRMPLSWWAERLNMPLPTLSYRINTAKWDVERALTTPARNYNRSN